MSAPEKPPRYTNRLHKDLEWHAHTGAVEVTLSPRQCASIVGEIDRLRALVATSLGLEDTDND